ncbi:MAG: LamG-like jellyroll fold domain-containing protein [bacterium]|jgi:hypothetical protein|nr:LamG domain-containing protein [Phycisphaerales bacterium]MCE2654223.1 LamG domain-containing protein [Planctomycetaceae bacterium]
MFSRQTSRQTGHQTGHQTSHQNGRRPSAKPLFGPARLRSMAATFAALLAALGPAALPSASAQPSVFVVPRGPVFDTTPLTGMSPSGRFLCGAGTLLFINFHAQWAIDMESSDRSATQLPMVPVGIGLERFFPAAAFDNGTLLGCFSRPEEGNGLTTLDYRTSNQFSHVPGVAGSLNTLYSCKPRISRTGRGVVNYRILENNLKGVALLTPTGPGQPMNVTPIPFLENALGIGVDANGREVVTGLDAAGNVLRLDLLSGVASVVYAAPVPFVVQHASGNGRVIAGAVDAGQGNASLFMWSAETGLQALPSEGLSFNFVCGIDEPGQVIITAGSYLADPSNPRNSYLSGYVHRRGHAPVTLSELAASQGLTGLPELCGPLEISADGSTIAGAFNEYWDQNLTRRTTALRLVVPPPLGDSCAAPQPATYGSTFSSTRGANRNSGMPAACGVSETTSGDVVFSFVPAATETVIIDTCGSDFDTTLLVTTDGCGNSLVTCNDDDLQGTCAANGLASRVQISVFQGQTYFIRVAGYNASRGGVQLNITAPNRPVNDQCTGALPIDAGSSREIIATNAIADQLAVCPGSPAVFSDVWYSTTAPASGRLRISNCGSNANTGIVIYNAAPCGSLGQPIACATAGCFGGGANAIVNVTAGQNLLIRVGGLFGGGPQGLLSVAYACDEPAYDAYRGVVMADTPAAFWRMDDPATFVAADQVLPVAGQLDCGRNPGVYFGSASRQQYGLWGGALSLNGQIGGVNRMGAPLPDPALPDGAFTVEAWVRVTDPLAGGVITQRLDPSEYSLSMSIGQTSLGQFPGRVMFFADGPGVLNGAISDGAINDGRWHHVVGIRDRTGPSDREWRFRIFVDGVLAGENNLVLAGTRIPQPVSSDGWWTIGSLPAWNLPFTGLIDEVALYTTALSPARIAEHYNIGKRQCSVADIAGVGGVPQPEGNLTGDDFVVFINAFSAGEPEADLVGIGGMPPPDGLITGDDFNAFIGAFAQGCP